jgi:hypothetical protein
MAEFLIIIFLILCHIVSAFNLISSGLYTGDLEGFQVKVGVELILGILVFIIAGYFLIIVLYRLTKDVKIHFFTGLKLSFNKKRFSILFLFVAIAQMIFFLRTGVGKVGGDATSPISFIFSMFSLNSLFGLYYFTCRSGTKRFLYFLNIVLYCALQLMKGWSGFLLAIFFYEIFLYFKRNPIKSVYSYTRVLIIPIIAILIGGKVYQYLHAYKNLVRFNAEIENTYSEGVTLLLSRLSFFPVAVGSFQNSNIIEDLYYYNYVPLRETQALFRPISPGFIMKDKDFRIIGNLVIQSFHPEVSSATSSNFGILSYLSLLFKINLFEFVLYILTCTSLVVLVKSLFDSIEQYKGELNFLYFMLLLNLYEVGSLEMVFGYGIVPIVFFIPIFLVFKIVVFQRR